MRPIVKQLTTPFLTILLALAFVYLFSALFGPLPLSVKNSNSDLFTVNGVGEESATPDSAQFSVGVTKTAPTVEAAQQQVNTATNAIVEQLKALGIEEKNIKTQNISSYPNYDATPVPFSVSSTRMTTSLEAEAAPDAGNENISGYTVSQDLVVTAKSIDIANKALDTAVANGANQISGVSFAINDEDRKALTQKARKKAIEDAKNQAKEIASDAGITLGRVVNIYVSDNQGGPMMMFDAKARNEAGTMSAPTELQPGENTVTVNVTLSYETR